MSHYEISYESMTEGHAKRGKAVSDILSYLGNEEFARVCALLVQAYRNGEISAHTDHTYRVALMMAGVQGYPCQALFELLFGAPLQDSQEAAQGEG